MPNTKKKRKKNGGKIPPVCDDRIRWIDADCGNCKECRTKKANEWRIRMLEEIRTEKNGVMVTFTFSNESIAEITNKHIDYPEIKGYALDNAIATYAVRHFLERWRKKFKKSVRHWLVTELGHKNTENIHLHGILWTNEKIETIAEIWKYGWVWPRREELRRKNFVNERTINYIVKYITKVDLQHKLYKSKILCSSGIGKNYINRIDVHNNKYNGINTDETYRTRTGHKIKLPTYYRNKIYTEEEIERMWIEKMDLGIKWVCGEKATNTEEYNELIEYHRKINRKLGYGDDKYRREQKEAEDKLRESKLMQRLRDVSIKNGGWEWDISPF